MLIDDTMNHNLVQNAFYQTRLIFEKIRAKFRRSQHYRKFVHLRQAFYRNLWEQAAAAVGAELDDVGSGFLRIRLAECSTFVREGAVMLDNQLILKIAGNKPLMTKLLTELGYPVLDYCRFDLGSLAKAYEFLLRANKPCVVKPAESGAAGKGITTSIRGKSDLRQAAIWASVFSRKLLIEEQVSGANYRLLYLNGRFLDAIRRDSPRVTGDGKSTIRDLIQQENRKRLESEPALSLHPITLDIECSMTLRQQHVSLKSVPEKGREIIVKNVVNQNNRCENESVTDRVHPSIVRLGADIATRLNIQLAGLDLMTTDISRPLPETGGIINEVNTMPGLHHHYFIKNAAAGSPVAEHILRYLLIETK